MPRYHARRTDREITEPEALASVLRRGRYATLALCQGGTPYIVTLSYGFDEPGRALYFHVARSGRKLDALAADPRVCATVVIDGGYEQGACKHHYESVVIEGRATIVTGLEEARHGMEVLVGHLEVDPAPVWERNGLTGDEAYRPVQILRLDIDEMTGKAGS
jgi:nitroimidazol reductase NimA-like FMN-containing flavoprotein (pyridoxamine 5'-phosphate oxidase superfamily)